MHRPPDDVAGILHVVQFAARDPSLCRPLLRGAQIRFGDLHTVGDDGVTAFVARDQFGTHADRTGRFRPQVADKAPRSAVDAREVIDEDEGPPMARHGRDQNLQINNSNRGVQALQFEPRNGLVAFDPESMVNPCSLAPCTPMFR